MFGADGATHGAAAVAGPGRAEVGSASTPPPPTPDERTPPVSWLGEFFAAIPDAIAALWTFGRGWAGLIVTLGSAVLTAVFLLLAHRLRETHGWVSATFGGLAATVASLWAFGILPSAWIYYLDGSRELLADTIIPTQIVINDFTVFGNFYQVVRDSVVMVETMVAMAAFTAIAIAVQKRYPRALMEGEEARPQSGGYK